MEASTLFAFAALGLSILNERRAARSEARAIAMHRTSDAEREERRRADEERIRLAEAATELVDRAVREASEDGGQHPHVKNSFEADDETRKLQPFVKSDPRVHHAYHADGRFFVEFTTLSPVEFREWERGRFIIQSANGYSRN